MSKAAPRLCDLCGKEYTPSQASRPSRFCSQACLYKSRGRHAEPTPCKFCGGLTRYKFCSDVCRTMDYFKRAGPGGGNGPGSCLRTLEEAPSVDEAQSAETASKWLTDLPVVPFDRAWVALVTEFVPIGDKRRVAMVLNSVRDRYRDLLKDAGKVIEEHGVTDDPSARWPNEADADAMTVAKLAGWQPDTSGGGQERAHARTA